MADQTKKAGATKSVPGLRIVSKVAGFRRAGRAWPAEPSDVRVDEFTKEQVAQLRSESGLVVTDIEIQVPAEAPAEAK